MKINFLLILILLILPIAYAMDDFPYNDIDGKGIRYMIGMTYLNATKGICVNETCLGGGTGSGTVTSVSGDGTYVTGTITTSGTLGFNESNLLALVNTTNFYQIYVDWVRVQNRPTFLSQFTDNLGDRGYNDLVNFTNSPGYITNDTANFTVDTYNTTAQMQDASILLNGSWNAIQLNSQYASYYYAASNPNGYTDDTAANTKHTPGDCPAGEFIQNTTTTGVECVAPAGGGTVTSVTFGTPYLDGTVITGSGTGNINISAFSALYVNRSDWTTHDDYPSNCAADNYVYGIGDTLSCRADQDTTFTASGILLDLTGTVFSVNEGTLTDENLCSYESTGTQLECTSTIDSSGDCTGTVCGGGHTHSEYLENVVEDTSPQLGADLDANGHDIELDAQNKVCLNGATCTQYIWRNAAGKVQIVG